MTKEQFIDRMAKNGSIKKIEAYRYVNLFINTLLECLKEEGTLPRNEVRLRSGITGSFARLIFP